MREKEFKDDVKKREEYWNQQEQNLADRLNGINNKKNIYCIGDCMTLGVNVKDYQSYPYLLQNKLNDRYTVINMGYTMLRIELLLRFSNVFAGKQYMPNDIACIWCGTNDLHFEYDTQKVFDNFYSYCALLRDKGLKIVAFTLLPRSNNTSENFEKNRQIFNQSIRDNFVNIIDVGADKNIGMEGQEMNPLYYDQRDNTHLNDNGYKLVADIAYDVIDKI
jgi:lysophospholipase L1-like esterase